MMIRASNIMTSNRLIINLLLIGLVLLDAAYVIVVWFFPDLWFGYFHGISYVDPEGLLRRAGAVWVAFTLVQMTALIKWQSQPYWLAIVAGLRSAELFTEWTYLYFAHDITPMGRIGLLVSTPANMVVCWFFFKAFLNQWNKPQ